MEEKHMIDIVNADGTVKEAQTLLLFKLEETGPEYIIYTFNELDANNMVKIYTSLFKESDAGFSLEDVPSDEEWIKIKDVMRKVISENKE